MSKGRRQGVASVIHLTNIRQRRQFRLDLSSSRMGTLIATSCRRLLESMAISPLFSCVQQYSFHLSFDTKLAFHALETTGFSEILYLAILRVCLGGRKYVSINNNRSTVLILKKKTRCIMCVQCGRVTYKIDSRL